jgi:ribonuclease III
MDKQRVSLRIIIIMAASNQSLCTDVQTLPYNPLNILVSEKDLSAIINLYGLQFDDRNIHFYRTAMVHRSYCTRKNENFLNGNTKCPDDCMPLQEESNERLEFLGDAVINLIIANYLYERYPDENEGFLTKMRTKLVNGTMLAHQCEAVGLARYVIISKQIEENNGRTNRKILEDCFEAFVGAMFMDYNTTIRNGVDGYKATETWLINMIEQNIDFSELIMSNNNYKDMLLKHYQHNFNYLPKFYEISAENTNSGKIYHICVKDKNEQVVATGKGYSKKNAENECAKQALTILGML